MRLDFSRIRQKLRSFAFEDLFIEDLGWDHFSTKMTVDVDGIDYALTAVAEKRGMAALLCESPHRGQPSYQTRRKIDRKVAKTIHEHVIVYWDSDRTTQIWQWVKRELGRPIACREHHFNPNQPGDSLIEKLQAISFSLDEEAVLTTTDVTSRVRAAFDVDRVTRRFYDRFKSEHQRFLSSIRGITDAEDRAWYASVMLDRLMFVYFIQKKGFLDDDIDYLRNHLGIIQRRKGKDKFLNFYRHFLLRLFHEGLGRRERSNELDSLLGKIPYLNGGLFQPHLIEARYGHIDIPDSSFLSIFDFFDQYQWHLDERPLRADNEINPDVLGYIFEKYINQKQMGAYYTKEDITAYIAGNTIIPSLLSSMAKKHGLGPMMKVLTRLLCEDPDRYIPPSVKKGIATPIPDGISKGLSNVSRRAEWNQSAPEEFGLVTETWRDVVTRRRHYIELRQMMLAKSIDNVDDLIAANLDIRQLYEDIIEESEDLDFIYSLFCSLKSLTILDPACGSGAFLFAALEVLEPLYRSCIDRMVLLTERTSGHSNGVSKDTLAYCSQILDAMRGHSSDRYFILKSIILDNLFGVDIVEEAVEICKLRLFLKLVAQVDSIDRIEPLPDIDFNIRAGNSLVGFTTKESVAKALTLIPKGKQNQMRLLLDTDKERLKQIERAALDADDFFQQFRTLQRDRDTNRESIEKAKIKLAMKLESLRVSLNLCLATEYGVNTGKDIEYSQWLSRTHPFHWFVEFYGIGQRGGFDVIIGNPPYVEYKNVKDVYQVHGYLTEECANLFAFMIERSLSLAQEAGRFGMIVPVASVCTEGYSSLQSLLKKQRVCLCSFFNDRPGRLFDGLEHARLTIILACTSRTPTSARILTTGYFKWFTEFRPYLFDLISYVDSTRFVSTGSFPKVQHPLEIEILSKLTADTKTASSPEIGTGERVLYYTRKLSHYVQILDFVPKIIDQSGKLRPPTELKELTFSTKSYRDAFLGAFNSSLFYWYLTVTSDCRNLNRRELITFPFDPRWKDVPSRDDLNRHVRALMKDLKKNSKVLKMKYEKLGELKIQCVYPKMSKSIIDEIDGVLGRHYGFNDEETDFIISKDAKFRVGLDSTESDDDD